MEWRSVAWAVMEWRKVAWAVMEWREGGVGCDGVA